VKKIIFSIDKNLAKVVVSFLITQGGAMVGLVVKELARLSDKDSFRIIFGGCCEINLNFIWEFSPLAIRRV